MKPSNSKKKIPPVGEWLFLSLMASITTSALMWHWFGAWWGIIEFLLSMAVCWIGYYCKKLKYTQEESDV